MRPPHRPRAAGLCTPSPAGLLTLHSFLDFGILFLFPTSIPLPILKVICILMRSRHRPYSLNAKPRAEYCGHRDKKDQILSLQDFTLNEKFIHFDVFLF